MITYVLQMNVVEIPHNVFHFCQLQPCLIDSNHPRFSIARRLKADRSGVTGPSLFSSLPKKYRILVGSHRPSIESLSHLSIHPCTMLTHSSNGKKFSAECDEAKKSWLQLAASAAIIIIYNGPTFSPASSLLSLSLSAGKSTVSLGAYISRGDYEDNGKSLAAGWKDTFSWKERKESLRN